jgi:acetylornithine deacetylase
MKKDLNSEKLSEKNDDILTIIDEKKNEYISFLQKLVKNSKYGEEHLQSVIAKKLNTLGCSVEILKLFPTQLQPEKEFALENKIEVTKRISVVGKKSGSSKGKSLLFFAHPDSEPVEDIEKWSHEPFSAEIEEEKMFGWGVADDLSGVAIMIGSLDAIITSNMPIMGDLFFCSTASKRNARGILAILKKGYTADAAIYLHPAETGIGLQEIKNLATGKLDFKIKIIGKAPDTNEPGHTTRAHLGVNPIEKAMQIVKELKKLDDKRGKNVYHALIEKEIGRSTNLLISYINSGNGNRLSAMPAECIIGGTLTFPPNEELEHVKREIINVIKLFAKNDEWYKKKPPKIEWIFGSQGAEVPQEHPLYRSVSNSIKTVTGITPSSNPLHGASDIRNPMLYRGIPTVGFGPLAGNLSQNKLTDEWISIPEYIDAIKVCARLILSWCNEK